MTGGSLVSIWLLLGAMDTDGKVGDLLGVVLGDLCGVEVAERLEVDEALLHWSDLLGLLPAGSDRLYWTRRKVLCY